HSNTFLRDTRGCSRCVSQTHRAFSLSRESLWRHHSGKLRILLFSPTERWPRIDRRTHTMNFLKLTSKIAVVFWATLAAVALPPLIGLVLWFGFCSYQTMKSDEAFHKHVEEAKPIIVAYETYLEKGGNQRNLSNEELEKVAGAYSWISGSDAFNKRENIEATIRMRSTPLDRSVLVFSTTSSGYHLLDPTPRHPILQDDEQENAPSPVPPLRVMPIPDAI